MNTRKTVYNKLFSEKTELAKHEVELALLDDLKVLVSKGKEVNGNMVDGQIEVRNIATRTIQLAKEHLKNLDAVSKLTNQMKSQADALGIDITKVKEYRDAFDFLTVNPKAATENIIKKLEGLK